MKLKLHSKLKFHKLEFQKDDRSLHFFQNSDRLMYISINNAIWSFWPKIVLAIVRVLAKGFN